MQNIACKLIFFLTFFFYFFGLYTNFFAPSQPHSHKDGERASKEGNIGDFPMIDFWRKF
jgi:hypothetical protein